MPQRRRLRAALVTAAAGATCLALGTPAWATVSRGPNNPPGANGTVKIDGVPLDDKVDNQPHVSCGFELEFFNFDQDEHANITIAGQAPSGSGLVYEKKNAPISDDPANGAENDHDAVITVRPEELNLAGLSVQPQQGYHLKVTVEIIGEPGAGKHKVFWMEPCAQQTAGGAGSTMGGGAGDSTATPAPGQSGTSGGGANAGGGNGGLPVTGAAAATMALVGLGLIGGGAVLLMRRRRKITFIS